MRPTPQLLDQPLPVESMTLLHEPIVESTELHWPDEAACAAFAAALARHDALADAFIELRGELGAGKTTFVRHLLQALGVTGRIKSPSYAVLESYSPKGLNISHLDFYRFDDVHEWSDAGLRDVFAAPGLKLVEWPDKAAGLPQADLRMHIEMLDESRRRVRSSALTPRGRALIE
jgi:tRNA threonylcarbamoyladenosine biosynthesis protein TsaE